jgi:hypothetical protein
MTIREGKALNYVSVPVDYAAGIQEGEPTPVYITPAGGGEGGTVQNANLSIQATDQGLPAGNARGANAVDLQTNRGSAGQVASASGATIGGGSTNTASGAFSTIAGGNSNIATAGLATVAGGQNNTASATHASIIGGQSNVASGDYSSVSGGQNNLAAGDYSHASGRNIQISSAGDRTQAHGYAAAAVAVVRPDSFYIYGQQLFFSVEQAAPTDASLLENGSGTFWFDAGTGELRVKLRTEAGAVLNGVVATLV